MGVPVRDFLKRRRDRAVGSVLGFAERELWNSLNPEQQQKLRRVVLDAMNGYHDAVLDLVSAEDGVARNDMVIELLERLNEKLERSPRAAQTS